MRGFRLACGQPWQPAEVQRVICPLQSSTLVVQVSTDAGVGFLKGMGNPAGNEALALELVGSELAVALGLSVPPFAVIEVAGITITTITGTTLDPGPAFVSQAVRGTPGDPSGALLKRINNPEHICLLIAFDTWIRNFDRCPPPDHLDPTPKWDNLFFAEAGRRLRLMVIDHTHAFTQDALEWTLADTHFEDDSRVFGAFEQFRPFVTEGKLRGAAAAIRAIDVSAIEQIVASIPLPWGPTTALRSRWVEALRGRAERIEQYLIDGLIAQRVMDV